MALIELENIGKSYRVGESDLNVLDGVTLQIEEGDFVAIIGPSGSGKSTLMQILGLLDRPSRGRFKLLGHDVSLLTDDEGAQLRCRSLGFIFQMFNLLPRTSALDNVALPLTYAAAFNRKKKAAQLLERVGLGDRMEHKPNQLSGGQQQRVAIARSLVNNPRLIFADEPTGNLASHQAEEVLDMLDEMNQRGITIVLVTHDPDIAARAHRILHIKDGRLFKDERLKPFKPLPTVSKPRSNLQEKAAGFRTALGELRDSVVTALRGLTSNKVRSGLSVLGILIGVAAVIAMLALGTGAQKAIETRISGLGSNLIMLRPEAPSAMGVHGGDASFSRLTRDDVGAIEKVNPNISRVEGNVTGSAQIAFGNQNRNVQMTGATPAYESMRNAKPYFGRFFTAEENKRMARVALLGQTTVTNLFGVENPIGKEVKINRINFTVIGILPTKGATGWRDQDDAILIPLETAMKRTLGKKYFDMINIECKTPESISGVMEDVRSLMRKRHRLPAFKEDDFNLRNMADIQATLESTTKTFTMLLAIVAGISLLVGGIGIMNIMLVSVSERTREIGLRKAVGATRKAILWQFLIEAGMLSFSGGLIGVALGSTISLTLSALAGWASVVNPSAVFLASFFSIGVGMVFGFWPARKASLLSPIEALRYE